MPRLFAQGAAAALLFSFVGSAVESAAQAQPQPPAASSPQGAAEQADALYTTGLALLRQSRWAEAERQFQKAWDLRKSYDIAANLGDCELHVDQTLEAAEHLAYAVREFPPSGKAPVKERLKQRFADARALVGGLKVLVEANGAEVLVDGRSAGRTPLAVEVFVEPGTHTVTVRVDGYEDAQATASVGKGGSIEVSLSPSKKVAKKKSDAAGSGPNMAVVIAGSVVAGVGIVGGAGLLVGSAAETGSANSQHSTLAASSGTAACANGQNGAACTQLHNTRQEASTFTNVGAWAMIGGGAVGAATLLYGLLGGRASETTQGVRAVPIVTSQGGGFMLTGAW